MLNYVSILEHAERDILNSEYARKHWVKQGVSGYPTPSEIKHQWRLKMMSWEKFWDWQWPFVVLIICGIYLTISLTGCTTVEKTSEEMKESWYKACVETSNVPDMAAEGCRLRADKIIFGE